MRVLLTRDTDRLQPLQGRLEAHGLEVACVPLLERELLPGDIARVYRDHPAPDAILATSPGALAALSGHHTPAWHAIPAVAVGPGTAQAMVEAGFTHVTLPAVHLGGDAVEALGDLHGKTLLWLRGEVVTQATQAALARSGARVLSLVTYRMTPDPRAAHDLETLALCDVVTLTSPVFARTWQQVSAPGPWAHLPVIAIGPSTAQAAQAVGLAVVRTADPYTTDGLFAAIVDFHRELPPSHNPTR